MLCVSVVVLRRRVDGLHVDERVFRGARRGGELALFVRIRVVAAGAGRGRRGRGRLRICRPVVDAFAALGAAGAVHRGSGAQRDRVGGGGRGGGAVEVVEAVHAPGGRGRVRVRRGRVGRGAGRRRHGG